MAKMTLKIKTQSLGIFFWTEALSLSAEEYKIDLTILSPLLILFVTRIMALNFAGTWNLSVNGEDNRDKATLCC